MKIVIDIPDEEYELVRYGNKSYRTELELMYAVANGTPLPEHHGRIIDESKITKIWYHEKKIETGTLIQPYIEIDHTDAPTIIEAEKGVIANEC